MYIQVELSSNDIRKGLFSMMLIENNPFLVLLECTYKQGILIVTNKKSLEHSRLSAGEEGIEPPLTVLETAALPLYYSPIRISNH